MALRKYKSSGDASSISMAPLNFSEKVLDKVNPVELEMAAGLPVEAEADVDIDIREVYFMIMQFLSDGPLMRTLGQFWNELVEHQLLPRRYHAWYSRSGARSGDEDDDGTSLPLGYQNLVERYSHIEKDHLIKLLKQLLLSSSPQLHGMVGGVPPNAADVPTLLGSGSFSLLGNDRDMAEKRATQLPGYLRWPHMQADQVHGLSLREIGGGFTKHHRAPSVRAACYAIAKPSTMTQKMQIIKKLRGHQNAVYCAIFDRSGQYVITGSDDRLVKIWSMETAFCLASCRGHEGDITDLAVSSNNTLVASSSNDFIIRVWRLPDGLPVSVLRGHTGAVTAIAFSPRSSTVYNLLSSSDDGSCRIWDTRHSQNSPRIYIPKPPDVVPGKSNDPSPNIVQRSCLILCCAFNSNGTVFVTGSSDTYARVWYACKSNPEDSEQPNHEMDLLSGHENDVNYVQFSECAVASRSSTADISKEENLPRFKNSGFTHGNIVTCSRDGSAIIWIPRSWRSHGKSARWTRAYHLKVPPPPMPPQPPRGGPRQRFQPTPRGVNMIVWSLDNRFVLAAIMDCRICVWNASDGSLVHSLIGHSESTFVLDVHPFNPRIAMSAGYDGKTIVWDIWEGTPVQIYETGRFKLVDGKFSPDGTSIVLSDEVGQIYIIAPGQGESQKDAKYDQFFLGDYRPLIQDSHGNVLDQESQLSAYRRNTLDLLCDSSMIPYPEPYQNMYQQRRFGILGTERPTATPFVKFSVGPTFNANTGDYQMLPIIDLDRWNESLPEIADAIDWELENELQSDETDSEYNVTDECSSEGEHLSLSNSSSGEPECSAEDSGAPCSKEGLRRSGRKKHKSKMDITTSSGRRVKRRNLDERDGTTVSRPHRTRKSRNGRVASRKKLSKSTSLRPRRRAACNALTLFSKITGDSTGEEEEEEEEEEEDDVSESCASESSSVPHTQSIESDSPLRYSKVKHARENEPSRGEDGDIAGPSRPIEAQANTGNSRRLVLKLSLRNRPKCHEHETAVEPSLKANSLAGNSSKIRSTSFEPAQASGDAVDAMPSWNNKFREMGHTENGSDEPNLPSGCKGPSIKWGEVKMRSSKRLRLSDTLATDAWSTRKACTDGHISAVDNNIIGHQKSEDEHRTPPISVNQIQWDNLDGGNKRQCRDDDAPLLHGRDAVNNDHSPEYIPNSSELHQVASNGHVTECSKDMDEGNEANPGINEHKGITLVNGSGGHVEEAGENLQPVYQKLRIKSNGSMNQTTNSSSKLKSVAIGDWRSSGGDSISTERNLSSEECTSSQGGDGSGSLEPCTYKKPISHGSKKPPLDSRGKMYSSVYKRSKPSRKKFEGDVHGVEESTSQPYTDRTDGVRRTRSMGETSRRGGNPHDQLLGDEWKPTTRMTVGLRSARIRRGNYNANPRLSNERKSSGKFSWLMLVEHEESYRYVPQKGDEVAYLRQGHEEYAKLYPGHEAGPVEGGLRAVEFCKVKELEYSTLTGSGESCCKLTLEFVDSSCSAIKLTLHELEDFPDFLVEKTRYVAAIERNWTHRDKCRVWWRNENGDGGSWWEGRILTVKPKSPEFPESPWERFVIKYKNDPSTHHSHSPWELHDVDNHWEHPCIDDGIKDEVLSFLARIEQPSSKDNYGIQKLNQVAHKSDFSNRFPVPLSPEVIRKRLENRYYRTIEAVEHDMKVMVANAKSYFSRNPEMETKMRRLSDAIDKSFSSL